MNDELYLMGLDLPGTPEECTQDNERLRKENSALKAQAEMLAITLEQIAHSEACQGERHAIGSAIDTYGNALRWREFLPWTWQIAQDALDTYRKANQ